MNIHNLPTVEYYLPEDNAEKIRYFYHEFNKVKLGYRQCYTTSPWENRTIYSEEEKRSIVDAYNQDSELLKKMHPKVERVPFSIFQSYCEQVNIPVYNYLSTLLFIKKHMNHESPLEHGSLTVRVIDASRSFSHQWVRSRIASHSQQSQRFVSESDPDYILPSSIRNHERAYKRVAEYFSQLPELIADLKKWKIPTEDIRCTFPNAITTQIVTTCNFREWMHIFNERCCTKAQHEIRYVSNKILEMFLLYVPFISSMMGPKCLVFDKCPELTTCGYYENVIKNSSNFKESR